MTDGEQSQQTQPNPEPQEPLRRMGCLPMILISILIISGVVGSAYILFS